jgi:hypothetical protein
VQTRSLDELKVCDRSSASEYYRRSEHEGGDEWPEPAHHECTVAAAGADESQIDASFCAAIRIAKEQKSVSLKKRAEGTYAEYRRQKASASGGRGFRLPLC